MLPSDKAKFAEVLNALALIKPGNSKLSTEALRMWWNVMQDWTIEDFTAAAEQLTKEVEFMPNPFHFEQLRKATGIGRNEAWSIALTRCTQHIEHPDDRITRAVRLVGGYRAIGHTTNDQLHWMQKRFMDAYDEVNESQAAREALPNIAQVGKLEASSIMAGLLEKIAEQSAAQ